MSADIYDQAYCKDAPIEWFYDSTLYTQVVRAFCRQCPIKEQCLQDCLEAEETPTDGKKFRSGIFGGTTPTGRNRLMGTGYDVITENWLEETDDNDSNSN